MTKRLAHIVCCVLLPLLVAAQTAAPTADRVLTQFLDKIDEQTLSAMFTLTVAENATTPISYNGHLHMRGDKFRLSLMGNEGAYDGKTYYLYAEDTDELTLTTPTREELLEANPILFARELRKQATVRFAASGKDTKRYVIELVPNNQNAGIQKFVLRLRKADLVPEEVSVREGKQTTTLRFTQAAYEKEAPSFVISKPGAFVNDLR